MSETYYLFFMAFTTFLHKPCFFIVNSCHDLTGWGLYEHLYGLVKKTSNRGNLPEDIFTQAIACTHYAIVWQLTKLDEHMPEKVGEEIEESKKQNNKTP